jgi:hypothetical protein
MDMRSGWTRTYRNDGLAITFEQYQLAKSFLFHESFIEMAEFFRRHSARQTGQHEEKIFSHYDYTSVTIEGRTSGAWHAVFDTVTVGDYEVWGADPWLLGFALLPQNPIDEKGIEKSVLTALASKACMDFANTVLGAQKGKGLGSLIDVAKAFFALPGQRLTRARPENSTLGVSNPIGRIASGNAQIYSLGNDPTLTPNTQMLQDADNVISELFHLAAKGDYYSDEDLAKAVHNSTYASDEKSLIDPRANIFDPRYIPYKKDPYDSSNSYSRYFHIIQMKYCTSEPGHERKIGWAPPFVK